MPDWPQGDWLLLDAAGPVAAAGIVRDGQWLARSLHEGEFLEWFQPAVREVLAARSQSLQDLSGVVCAGGPGSTLGLRLAAMFVRSLLTVPALEHWKCYQYQNLEAGLLSLPENTSSRLREAVAPWRRDRLHLARLLRKEPPAFSHGMLTMEENREGHPAGFILGRRPANQWNNIAWRPFPLERLPGLLRAHPSLLRPTTEPAPYQAETADFARWTAQRHSAP